MGDALHQWCTICVGLGRGVEGGAAVESEPEAAARAIRQLGRLAVVAVEVDKAVIESHKGREGGVSRSDLDISAVQSRLLAGCG